MLKKLIIAFMILAFIATASEAAIRLKIAVVNPSSVKSKTSPVKFELPKGVGPEQIVDIGEMELKYDLEKNVYYVYQEVDLQPSEKKILEIQLKDIWTIPGKEINFLKTHTSKLTEKLAGTKHVKVGMDLAERIKKELGKIGKTQASPILNARERMNLYYENIGLMREVRNDIGMLENLVLDVGGIVEERVEIPETLSILVGEQEEKVKPENIMELTVKAVNPSETKTQPVDLKFNLPEEVTPRYILESDGLEVAYDFNEGCFYVFKDKVELEPSETKIFIIKIKDIWRIPDGKLDALRSHTKNLMLLLEGTKYESQGVAIADKIYVNMNAIIKTQSLKATPTEHMAYYRNNTGTFEGVKKYVAQLEKIVSQSGASPGVTITRAERLKGGGPEAQRPTGYKGLKIIAESIFKGKAPSVATTWRIIFTIMGFIGVLSAAFFALWFVQVKKGKKK